MSSSKPAKPAKPTIVPPQNIGRILIRYDDLDALRFWIRVFQLEPFIATTQVRLNHDIKAVYATVPVISEYVAGDLTWIYALVLFVDRLGICGGSGIVYFADAINLDKVREKRDDFANKVLEHFHATAATSDRPVESMIINPGKEQ